MRAIPRDLKQRTRDAAIRMRLNPTPAEAALWERLRLSRLGVRFRQQSPLLGFIADFYCVSAQLVVEVDGGIHSDPEHKAYDRRRDAAFRNEAQVNVLRVTNDQVLGDIENVVEAIKAALLWEKPRRKFRTPRRTKK